MWVFTRSGSNWTQDGGKLTGGGESGEGQFGISVALSAEGTTALIGAFNDDPNVGAAWAFTHSGEAWVQEGAKITGRGEMARETFPGSGQFSEASFGSSVALASDGNTALIGGPGDNGGLGAAWVFVHGSAPPSQAPTVVTGAASSVTQSSAMLSATVNPNGASISQCQFEYGTTTLYGKSVSCSSSPGSGTSAVPVSAGVTGLSPNTTYYFRISATNAGGTSEGSGEAFKTVPEAPTVVTGTASSATRSEATLHATVNPNGGTVSDCKFDYGTTMLYGASVPCSSASGSGTSPVAVSGALTGLSPNMTYYFRISATNEGGTSEGSDEAFKTLPEAPSVVTVRRRRSRRAARR